mmetsp:Transcript_53246/g.133676  ORF Transcript_53246/g.133676 Transcript_53246/m.133676 type:complete len:217 (+) Transcript_53246:796-1446(+)
MSTTAARSAPPMGVQGLSLILTAVCLLPYMMQRRAWASRLSRPSCWGSAWSPPRQHTGILLHGRVQQPDGGGAGGHGGLPVGGRAVLRRLPGVLHAQPHQQSHHALLPPLCILLPVPVQRAYLNGMPCVFPYRPRHPGRQPAGRCPVLHAWAVPLPPQPGQPALPASVPCRQTAPSTLLLLQWHVRELFARQRVQHAHLCLLIPAAVHRQSSGGAG